MQRGVRDEELLFLLFLLFFEVWLLPYDSEVGVLILFYDLYLHVATRDFFRYTLRMNIKGLIFDLDGTITLTQQFHYQAFSKVFADHGVKYTEDDDLFKYAGMGSGMIFPTVFADHGISLTDEQIKQYSSEKKEIYMKILEEHEILPVPGVKDFLKKITERGYQICIASGNKLEAIEYLLARVGVRDFFEIIVTNKDAKKPKPAPDIFLAAAVKLGLLPSQCVVFEDAVNGVQASESAGIRCIALTTRTPADDLRAAGADYIVQSYDDVRDEMIS